MFKGKLGFRCGKGMGEHLEKVIESLLILEQ